MTVLDLLQSCLHTDTNPLSWWCTNALRLEVYGRCNADGVKYIQMPRPYVSPDDSMCKYIVMRMLLGGRMTIWP